MCGLFGGQFHLDQEIRTAHKLLGFDTLVNMNDDDDYLVAKSLEDLFMYFYNVTHTQKIGTLRHSILVSLHKSCKLFYGSGREPV